MIQLDNAPDFSNLLDVLSYIYTNSLDTSLPNFSKVVLILATLPLTSCSAERVFSSLRQTLTYLRNSMGEIRLSSLIVIQQNRDIANWLKGKIISLTLLIALEKTIGINTSFDRPVY